MDSWPCEACMILKRKCASDCVFAPYFSSELGSVKLAAIHQVFGVKNVSKLLLNIPVQDRSTAVATLIYEAEARLRDPVHGLISHILALQHKVVDLEVKVMEMEAQLADHQTSTAGDLSNSSESAHQIHDVPPN